MTTKQADKAIESGKYVRVCWPKYGPFEVSEIRIIRRDRFNIYTSDGAMYDRKDTELVTKL
jgi:hypothetical protein